MASAVGPRRERNDQNSRGIWTIGHWTCPPDVVLETLGSADIEVLVDVRKMPGSRRSPQFDADEMPSWLDHAGIEYLHLSELGGRRPKRKDVDPALNAGWQNASFKNYADYTLTAEFEAGLAQLTELAGKQHVALMCGEPMPWRCHRLLISNTLTARGWTVVHLMNGGAPKPHELGQWGAAPVISADGVLTYPQKSSDLSTKDRRSTMSERLKVGDHVTWNSEAGHVSGTITNIHTEDFDFKGRTRRASEDEPQYEIASDKTDHVAAHKGTALRKLDKKADA